MSRSGAVEYAPAAALLAIGVALQCATIANHDVAWLLTLAERLLSGARPDIDFIEFNPPASYLIYVPAASIARLLGVQSEPVLIGLIAASVVLSTWTAGLVLRHAQLIERWQTPTMMFASVVALMIFSYSSFAQREHVALIAVLPMLAVYASRMGLVKPNSWTASLSGIGGGIALCIKPYFALALVLPLIGVVWNNRRKGRIFEVLFAPEQMSAAFVVLIYGAAVIGLFPAFIDRTLPLVLAVYLPVREPFIRMLTGVRFGAFILMTVALVPLGIRGLLKPVPLTGFLAATGFLLAMFAQGRIWFDHAYPALALLMLVTAWLMTEGAHAARELGAQRRFLAWIAIVACSLPAVTTIYASSVAWHSESNSVEQLASRLRPLLPSHPKVMAISESYAFVPIARALHGTWEGSTYFQIISWNAGQQLARKNLDPATRAELEAYASLDRKILSSDIRLRRPDVVLIDGTRNRAWAFSHAEIVQALQSYREVRKIDQTSVWLPVMTNGSY